MRDKWRAPARARRAVEGGQGKAQPGKGIADKCFFIGQWAARKNVIAPPRRRGISVCSPAIFGRNTSSGPQSQSRRAASRRERAASKGQTAVQSESRVWFQYRVHSISKTFFHITASSNRPMASIYSTATWYREYRCERISVRFGESPVRNNVFPNALWLFVGGVINMKNA